MKQLLFKKHNDVAFKMVFNPGQVPYGLITQISGTRYDYLTEADEVNGVETAFAPNTPVITWRGLRGCSAYINYFLNSKVPVTQNVTLAAAGTYSVYIYGTGTAAITGASTGNGVCTGTGSGTKSNVVTFTTDSPGMTITVTIAGAVNRCQINNGQTGMPFIPTAGVAVGSASELGSTSNVLNFSLYPKFKIALNSAKIELRAVVEILYYPLTGNTNMCFSVRDTDSTSPLYLSAYRNIKSYDGTLINQYAVNPLKWIGKHTIKSVNGKPPDSIKSKYGLTEGLHKQIIFDEYASIPSAYDGSYNADSKFIFYKSTAEFCMYTKDLAVFRKVKSWV